MPKEYPTYTDMSRTEMIRKATRGKAPADPIGNTQAIAPKEKLFEGLSVAQVLASAGAAATSMLLASKIGIAGSVIGAAVSSVVTLLATQVYRKVLSDGARKLQEGARESARSSVGTRAEIDGKVASPACPTGASHARLAPSELRERAARQRKAQQRKVAVASVAVAIAAVALAAGGVMLATEGEGLGEKPAPIFNGAPAEEKNAAAKKSSANREESSAPGEKEPGRKGAPVGTSAPQSANRADHDAEVPATDAGTNGAGTDADGSQAGSGRDPSTNSAGTDKAPGPADDNGSQGSSPSEDTEQQPESSQESSGDDQTAALAAEGAE